RFGEVSSIRGFLTAETNTFQIDVIYREQSGRRDFAEMGCELVKTCFRRGERNLLFENDIQKCRKSRRPIPKRRRSICVVNDGKLGMLTRETFTGEVQCSFG